MIILVAGKSSTVYEDFSNRNEKNMLFQQKCSINHQVSVRGDLPCIYLQSHTLTTVPHYHHHHYHHPATTTNFHDNTSSLKIPSKTENSRVARRHLRQFTPSKTPPSSSADTQSSLFILILHEGETERGGKEGGSEHTHIVLRSRGKEETCILYTSPEEQNKEQEAQEEANEMEVVKRQQGDGKRQRRS